jgi:hypothetical protein
MKKENKFNFKEVFRGSPIPNRLLAIKIDKDGMLHNTVVSNHFHSVKILLFSSARSHDFDRTPGTELPVSMYTIVQSPVSILPPPD